MNKKLTIRIFSLFLILAGVGYISFQGYKQFYKPAKSNAVLGISKENYLSYTNTSVPNVSVNIPKEEFQKSKGLAEQWLVNNLNTEGYFTYQFDPQDPNKVDNENNMIRQLMSSRLLAEMSQNDEKLKELHKKNLDYIYANWYKDDGQKGYIIYGDLSNLGSNAMLLRTLVASPFFDKSNTQSVEKIVNSMYAVRNTDGSFSPYLIGPTAEYNKDYLNYFYSGEAILSFIELYEKTGNLNYLETAKFSEEYYINLYVTNIDQNYYPAYVPWHTLCLNKLYTITGDQKYADAIFVLNDKLLEIQNQTGSENTTYLGRFFNVSKPDYGSPHSASDAVYLEGLAYALEIAEKSGNQEHITKYKDAIALGTFNLMGLQYRVENSQGVLLDTKTLGAIKINTENGQIRVDTTQHTIDAFRKIEKIYK